MNNQPLLPPKPGDECWPTILCFDEARNLLDSEHNDEVFRSLRLAAKSLATDSTRYKGEMLNFFLVLLDTTSKISNFTPPNRYDPSSKASNIDLFYPIHQIDTLDVFAPLNPPDPSGHRDDVRKLFSFGRPLWGAFFEAGYTAKSLLGFAIKKISGYQNENLSDYGIALLTYRMNFYISSPALAENLVASMMRYMISVSEDRSSLITTQPSEPILAFAASRILQDPAIRLSCIKSWIGGLHSGAVNPGDIGEQVASLVLLFAFDYAAHPTDNLPHAISLSDFLAALLGDHTCRDISHAFSNSSTTQSLLRKGQVFFNHFVRTTQKPTLEDLEKAYRRGFAIFLPPNFTGMDIGIPIRMPAGRMALLLLQIKNRKSSSPTPGLKTLMTEDLHKARKALNLPDLHGTIGLAMCLRSREKTQSVILRSERPAGRITRKMSADNAKGKRKAKTQGNSEANSESEVESESADFLGMVFGLDTTVYPCLRWTAKPERPESAKAKPELEEMCELLRRLLETWPIAYADKDIESNYAKKLLDPFY